MRNYFSEFFILNLAYYFIQVIIKILVIFFNIIVILFEDICALAFIRWQCFSYITHVMYMASFSYTTCMLKLPLDCDCQFSSPELL